MAMIRRAAHRITPAFAARLAAILDDQRRCSARNDHQAFYVADEEFHRTISQCAGSLRIWRIINSAKAQLDRVRYLSLEDRDWLAMIFHEHQDIVAHITAHDGAAASRAMQLHLRTVFAAIDRIAATHAEFFEQPTETE